MFRVNFVLSSGHFRPAELGKQHCLPILEDTDGYPKNLILLPVFASFCASPFIPFHSSRFYCVCCDFLSLEHVVHLLGVFLASLTYSFLCSSLSSRP